MTTRERNALRKPQPGEQLFEIIETVRYQVPARDAAAAVRRLEQSAADEREAAWFEAIVEREVADGVAA